MVPPTRSPARMSAAARREQILEVATWMVAERGFHEVSIEGIARSAGVTRATLYKHFPDLYALLDAVVERETAVALEEVSRSASGLRAGEPTELLLARLGAYLRAVESRPATWRLILMPPEGSPEELHGRIAQGRESVLAELADAIGSALRTRGPGAADPELTATTLSVIADEYARLLLTDPMRYRAERLIAHARWVLTRLWRRG